MCKNIRSCKWQVVKHHRDYARAQDGRLYAVILLVSAHNEQVIHFQLQLSTTAYKNAAELKSTERMKEHRKIRSYKRRTRLHSSSTSALSDIMSAFAYNLYLACSLLMESAQLQKKKNRKRMVPLWRVEIKIIGFHIHSAYLLV